LAGGIKSVVFFIKCGLFLQEGVYREVEDKY